MKARLRRATAKEAQEWAKTQLYPLKGFVVFDGHQYPLEDLRGSWSAPDPIWEVHAPKGWHFGGGMYTHTILGGTQADILSDVVCYPLQKCTAETSQCGCELCPN